MRSSSATATIGTADPARPYRGRFAPTPSGPLHFGSLIAATGSFLEARYHSGEWLLRIEDLDPPRERPGAADQILRTLDSLGLHWDGPVLKQNERSEAYRDALARLEDLGLTRRCACSRNALKSLSENRNLVAGEDLFHPPRCLVASDDAAASAIRFRAPDREISFEDRSLGRYCCNVARSSGDFVLRRRDGLFAYQLAVTADDAQQGITDVVRGADLLGSTPRQILLQEALQLPRVNYMHLPLAVTSDGYKLSKSEDAPAAEQAEPAAQIFLVLEFLNQDPPEALKHADLDEVWAWAEANWRAERFAGISRKTLNTTAAGT